MKTTGAVLLAVLATAACQTERAAISLVADPAQRSELVGEWRGEYGNSVTKRAGSIAFFLLEGEDQAHGDVLMIPAGTSEPYRPSAASTERASLRRGPELLTIRFVHAEEGRVTGSLEPYWDPECECEVRTSFVGELQGDRIVGIYTALSGRPGIGRTTGWWEVHRKPLPARRPPN